jgi:hypothetical protein
MKGQFDCFVGNMFCVGCMLWKNNLFGLLEISSNIWFYFGVGWFVGNIVVYVCWWMLMWCLFRLLMLMWKYWGLLINLLEILFMLVWCRCGACLWQSCLGVLRKNNLFSLLEISSNYCLWLGIVIGFYVVIWDCWLWFECDENEGR